MVTSSGIVAQVRSIEISRGLATGISGDEFGVFEGSVFCPQRMRFSSIAHITTGSLEGR